MEKEHLMNIYVHVYDITLHGIHIYVASIVSKSFVSYKKCPRSFHNLTMTLIDFQTIEGSTTKIDCKNIN